MKKFVLLLIALAVAPWARTWEDAGTFYSYARFDDDSLDDSFDYSWPTEEIMRNPYFVGEFERIDSTYYSLGIRNDSNDTGDSVWISKYWMDDSLRKSPVVMDANVDLDDFRLLSFDSLHTEYILSTMMDERAEQASWQERRSLFFLYKKDSSYYALCLLGYSSISCVFYMSCQFQDDGTTNFEKVPDAEGIEFPGCPVSLPQSSRRIPARLQESVPYLVNGTRSRGGASSVIIRNGQPEVKLGE